MGEREGERKREKMCEVIKVSVGGEQGREQTDNILGNISMV